MLNQCHVIGRLGKDPEIKSVGTQGLKTAKISLAVSKKWRDPNGQMQERTEWVPFTFWRGQAEFLEKFCRKGDLLYCSGEFRVDKWEDRDNQPRYTTYILGDQVQRLQGKQNGERAEGGGGGGQGGPAAGGSPMFTVEDLPF